MNFRFRQGLEKGQCHLAGFEPGSSVYQTDVLTTIPRCPLLPQMNDRSYQPTIISEKNLILGISGKNNFLIKNPFLFLDPKDLKIQLCLSLSLLR